MQCKSYSVNSETVIHGDLGIWNLLFTERHVFIIDMAEARMGDRHFDLAAVITSSIPLTASRTEMEKSLSLFERGYAQEQGVWDNRRLFEQLHLWLLRGMLALVMDQGMSAPNVSYIERQLNILEEYKSLLV
ncbi:phosphotransferase [Paenibacillus sp. JJ-223]|uniref:phosphotransferase n=1 Tax=Paenibacillus sp. JJ-223 TaxID=2905647 RepID=UPI001F19E8B5|nr:phosphotransferase [Paenibacillus sp. JJ-223]